MLLNNQTGTNETSVVQRRRSHRKKRLLLCGFQSNQRLLVINLAPVLTQCPLIFCPCSQTTNLSLHWRRTYCPCLRSRKLHLGWSGSYRSLRPSVWPYHKMTQSLRLRMIGSPCAPSSTSSCSAFTSSSWHCTLALSSSSGPAGALPNHKKHFVTLFLTVLPLPCAFQRCLGAKARNTLQTEYIYKYCMCKSDDVLTVTVLCCCVSNNAVATKTNSFKQREQYI